MFELIKAGGLLMWPIIACSIVAMAIMAERMWAYRKKRVVPQHLLSQIWQLHKDRKLTAAHVQTVRDSSPLGRVLAA